MYLQLNFFLSSLAKENKCLFLFVRFSLMKTRSIALNENTFQVSIASIALNENTFQVSSIDENTFQVSIALNSFTAPLHYCCSSIPATDPLMPETTDRYDSEHWYLLECVSKMAFLTLATKLQRVTQCICLWQQTEFSAT